MLVLITNEDHLKNTANKMLQREPRAKPGMDPVVEPEDQHALCLFTDVERS